MSNPFLTDRMAEGYARSRPPVHARVIELARPHLARGFRRALDLGCGSGISTKALAGLAAELIGIDPVEPMTKLARHVVPGAAFVAGSAEAIPLRAGSVDLIAAAGALNYVELGTFRLEAERILTPGGLLLVYDFGPGKSFPDSGTLDEWFEAFSNRYPWPAAEAAILDPERLAATGWFRLTAGLHFEIPIPLTSDFFVDYMMTETNVAAAIRRGIPEGKIRAWVAKAVQPLWRRAEEDILFRGYCAVGTVSG